MPDIFVRRLGLLLVAALCLIALGHLLNGPGRLKTLLGILALYAVIGGMVLSIGAIGYRALSALFDGLAGRK